LINNEAIANAGFPFSGSPACSSSSVEFYNTLTAQVKVSFLQFDFEIPSCAKQKT
jgi:hypothetical protein